MVKVGSRLKTIAEIVARGKGVLGTDDNISNGWYYHFMERQNDLTLHKPG